MAYQEALTALADPTRRRLVQRLRRRERSVGQLARALHVSQPAVSQHLLVLRGCRLVRERRQGTRHYYRASPQGLRSLRTYIEALWRDAAAVRARRPPRGTRGGR
jgi:DNA-binding transcriptional ArsR family regulator